MTIKERIKANKKEVKDFIAYLKYQCLKFDLPLKDAIKNMGYEEKKYGLNCKDCGNVNCKSFNSDKDGCLAHTHWTTEIKKLKARVKELEEKKCTIERR